MARVDDRGRRAAGVSRAGARTGGVLPAGDAADVGFDVRALVVGERVVASIERVGEGWRFEPRARRSRAPAAPRSGTRAPSCACARRPRLGADYAGVDLLRTTEGADYVLEVNGIPGWQGVERATGVDVAAALVGASGDRRRVRARGLTRDGAKRPARAHRCAGPWRRARRPRRPRPGRGGPRHRAPLRRPAARAPENGR